ncbi:hypothetical protein BHM03_00042054 [Ensete ventricosum]|nr:hypothetical protein BHM03_00042054 [Ensete ventricosum]
MSLCILQHRSTSALAPEEEEEAGEATTTTSCSNPRMVASSNSAMDSRKEKWATVKIMVTMDTASGKEDKDLLSLPSSDLYSSGLYFMRRSVLVVSLDPLWSRAELIQKQVSDHAAMVGRIRCSHVN